LFRIRSVVLTLMGAIIVAGLTPGVAAAGIGKMDGRGADYQAYSRMYDSVINMNTRGDAIAGVSPWVDRSTGGPPRRSAAW
jgi:hypothetical protein